MEKGGGGAAVIPKCLVGGGEGGGVGGGGWVGGPVEELAVGGVAEVVVGVGVGLVEGEGTDDDGQGFEGFQAVTGAAFAGDDAFDVALEREGDGEDELAVTGGDGEGMVEGEVLAVGGEGDGAGDGDGGNGCVIGEDELGV
jgi:hypothetical protein